jgi:phosphoribosylamine-glycine ligase
MKFIFFSEFGETLDLASYLTHVEHHEVLFHVHGKDCANVGKGIVNVVEDWYRYMGDDYTWIFDSCAFGKMQDWLRSKGEAVCGGCEGGDFLENNRQENQRWFNELGFNQVFSKNFTSVDDAIKFIEKHAEQKWILKQNGDAPKSINHLGKLNNSVDMLYHLRELKKGWSDALFGKFDCDLMEVVEGVEVAASAFFNGTDFLRNEDGLVTGYLNFEDKKEVNGSLGETTGEMGTTFFGVTEDNDLFSKIMCRDGIVEKLTEIGFRGVFDINCIVDGRRIVGLEPTMRFGIPATSYEFMEGLASGTGELIDSMARGLDNPVTVHESVGMVMCVVAKPFPIEADVEESATSLDEKLWILDGDDAIEDFTDEQRPHIHLYNFKRETYDEDGTTAYKVATKSGYMLTVTGRGASIKSTRNALIKFIKKNIYLSGMKYRTDIGSRAEEVESDLL